MGSETPLSLPGKAGLALKIWSLYPRVLVGLRREPLPTYVARLGETGGRRAPRSPAQLARAVDRSLRLGSRRPRCLVSALVLYRLLREQGDGAQLVIGLPEKPADKDAHAWVELAGADVGPPPGKGYHEELARFK
ncbi:MAG: lasso peptide biosynthesis B2 protein [Gaiellaceae bacterium]